MQIWNDAEQCVKGDFPDPGSQREKDFNESNSTFDDISHILISNIFGQLSVC